MLRYQRGEREAFAELVKRFQVPVYNYVLRHLGSALAADEISQRVFLGVVMEASRFDYETPFATRLFSIASRLCEREVKRSPARPEQQPAAEPPWGHDEPPGAQTLDHEERLERAVDGLPHDEKDVFLLREVADLPFPDIALITRQTPSAVKLHMQNALSRLRLVLERSESYRRALWSSGGSSSGGGTRA